MTTRIDAGEYSHLLTDFIETMKGNRPGDVPCGDCVGCCTSSKFILVRPTDTAARQRIPKALLFPAPGLPPGYDLMGYDEHGHCPMFKNGGCTIYDTRPETCRQYDCRVLAATGADPHQESAAIQDRISAWQFSYRDDRSHRQAAAVTTAMTFLQDHADDFPQGYVPPSPGQQAALAIRIHEEFLDRGTCHAEPVVGDLIDRITRQFPAH